MTFTAADIVRFWEHVDSSGGQDACWPWKLGVDKDGYGKFTTTQDGRQTHHRAHRFSLQLRLGRRPGAVVRHSCNNPVCCNQAHLKEGTHADNVADRVAQNRSASGDNNGARLYPQPRGEKHHNCKLTDDDIRVIKEAYTPRKGVGELARRFGISPSTVTSIGTGRYRR